MGPDNTAHMERILARFSADFRAKYEAGQREHGGEMWRKDGMLLHALGELQDLVAYLYTLVEQEEIIDRRVGRVGPSGLRPLSQAAVTTGREPR